MMVIELQNVFQDMVAGGLNREFSYDPVQYEVKVQGTEVSL
jgi:hypothetical protein